MWFCLRIGYFSTDLTAGPQEFASHEVPAAGEILFVVGSQVSSPSASRSLICRGKVDVSVTSAALLEHHDQHN